MGRRWLQRLRDGEFVDPAPVLLGSGAGVVGGAAGAFVLGWSPSLGGAMLAVAFCGALLLVVASWFRLQDRETMRRVSEVDGRPVRLYLPVRRWRDGLRTLVGSGPTPNIWTCDDEGLHGWAPEVEGPVARISWTSVEAIAESEYRVPYYPTMVLPCLRLETASGSVRLRARYGLGSATGGHTPHDLVLIEELRAILGRATGAPVSRPRPAP